MYMRTCACVYACVFTNVITRTTITTTNINNNNGNNLNDINKIMIMSHSSLLYYIKSYIKIFTQ